MDNDASGTYQPGYPGTYHQFDPRYEEPSYNNTEYHQSVYNQHRASFSAPYGFLQTAFESRVAFSGPTPQFRQAPQFHHVQNTYSDMEMSLAMVERPRQLSQSMFERQVHFLETHPQQEFFRPISEAPVPFLPEPAPLMKIKSEPISTWSSIFQEEPSLAEPKLEPTMMADSREPSFARSAKPPSSSKLAALLPKNEGDSEANGSEKDENREWICPVGNCGKSYRFKGDLKYHVKRKHPERMDLPGTISKPRSAKEGKSYPCPVSTCSCGFKWARDLRRHIKTKHPENDDDSSSSSDQTSASASKPSDSTNFVTLSISSIYDDASSMLSLPASLMANDRN